MTKTRDLVVGVSSVKLCHLTRTLQIISVGF